MEYLINFLILTVSILVLWWGAVWVVESASSIAYRLGMPELIIGLTVVALGTSAPEFAVTITAALRGHADISVGNVVGSNVFNMGFILGGLALIRPLNASRSLIYRDGVIMIISGVMLLWVFFDLELSRFEGIILFSSLIIYLTYLFIKKEPLEEEVPHSDFHWYEIPRLLTGLGLIIGGGHFLVEAATFLARGFGVTEWAIGVTVVAAGTSAPEFATSLVAVSKGKHGISAGNLIGSNLFNLFGVLGLAGIIKTLTIDSKAYFDVVLLLVLIIIAVLFLRTGWRVSRWEGFALILIGFISWLINIF